MQGMNAAAQPDDLGSFYDEFFTRPHTPLESVRVVSDLQWLVEECTSRCIIDGVTWASEIMTYLPDKWIEDALAAEEKAEMGSKNKTIATALSVGNRTQVLGRNLMIGKDFHRAAFFLAQSKDLSPEHFFLYYWCQYLLIIHENLENDVESIERKAADRDEDVQMAQLYVELNKIEEAAKMDSFMYYLYGKVQWSLLMPSHAKKSFEKAIKLEPRLWPAWRELVDLVENMAEMDEMKASVGDTTHWYADWFEAQVLPRMHYHEQAIQKTRQLAYRGLGQQPMLLTHIATSYNLMHEHDPAIEHFKVSHAMDPYRIQQMNLFSDSLYIRMDRVTLGALAHSFFRTHKYFWETCCITSNYYSMRGEHDASIRFLQRSLRLNPNSASTWTLIGHELMELKNHSAACMSYRKAIDIDPTDHRGWYGLGQLYDILKMHTFSLFYYQQAHKCKPMDSRMLVALGEVYSKSGAIEDAEKCFIKAFKVGDVEGTALLMLAKLYEGVKDEHAAAVYWKYLVTYKEARADDPNVPTCIRFLAKYNLNKGDLEEAIIYAQTCTEFEATREEGRFILRQAMQKRQRILPRNMRSGRNPSFADCTTPGIANTTPAPVVAADATPREDVGGDEDMALSDGDGDVSF